MNQMSEKWQVLLWSCDLMTLTSDLELLCLKGRLTYITKTTKEQCRWARCFMDVTILYRHEWKSVLSSVSLDWQMSYYSGTFLIPSRGKIFHATWQGLPLFPIRAGIKMGRLFLDKWPPPRWQTRGLCHGRGALWGCDGQALGVAPWRPWWIIPGRANIALPVGGSHR